MTESEAIEYLETLNNGLNEAFVNADELSEALQMAIKALEKQIPKKPIKSEKQVIRYVTTYCCPTCKLGFTGTGVAKWCYHCGQKLDWSNEE